MTTSSTISTPFYLGKWYPITGRRRKVTKLKGCLITRYMQQEKKNCLEYLSLLFFWLSRQWSHLSRSCLSIIFLYGARAILAIYPYSVVNNRFNDIFHHHQDIQLIFLKFCLFFSVIIKVVSLSLSLECCCCVPVEYRCNFKTLVVAWEETLERSTGFISIYAVSQRKSSVAHRIGKMKDFIEEFVRVFLFQMAAFGVMSLLEELHVNVYTKITSTLMDII